MTDELDQDEGTESPVAPLDDPTGDNLADAHGTDPDEDDEGVEDPAAPIAVADAEALVDPDEDDTADES